MTTIAVDSEGNISADQRMTEGGLIVSESFNKIRMFTSPEYGRVYIACAGAVNHIEELFDYIEQMFKETLEPEPNPLKFHNETMQVIMLDEEGAVKHAEFTELSTDLFWVDLDKPYAIGSGSHLAIGAMEAGANSKEAVIIAGKRDAYSNTNVTSYSYKELSYKYVIKDQIEDLATSLSILENEYERLSDAEYDDGDDTLSIEIDNTSYPLYNTKDGGH